MHHYKMECFVCGETFIAKREYAKYCSSKCRQKAYIERQENLEADRRTEEYNRKNESMKLYGWLLLIAGVLLLLFVIFPSLSGEYSLIFEYYGSTAISLGTVSLFIAVILFIAAKS